MAELNLKQITDKLSSEFSSDVRRLIFWYDARGDFALDIDSMELENAKIIKLEPDNQFYIKYLLERQDTTTNYLIYAPFAKPSLRDNHLADTIKYSKEFFADRASLLAVDLGIDEKYKQVLQKYIKFFASKDRTQKFYDLEIERFNQRIIETALMSVLCKSKVVSFEEVVRTVITAGDLEDNRYLQEFEKYDLLSAFWQMCEETFGGNFSSPSLVKLVNTMFTTYTSKVVMSELPSAWRNYCSHKSGNIIAFLDSLMNSMIYRGDFDGLSDMVYSTLDGETVLSSVDISQLIELEIFKKTDVFILKWMIDRLEHDDLDARLNDYSIVDICKKRRKMHFKDVFSSHYYILENAYYLLKEARYKPAEELEEITKNYITKDYIIDQKYRYFYYHYDNVPDSSIYENLRELVENVYTNRFLNPLAVVFSRALCENKGKMNLTSQQDFYSRFVKNSKERTVVIISDAFRFEVGQTLLKRLMEDEKCTASIQAMMSMIPSYTRFGMSALLPHKSLDMTEDYRVTVDGKVCDDLKSREQILKAYNENSRALQFDDIKGMKMTQLKELFTGQEVVYIYHNQIDARGDKLNTENEVFIACEEAIKEIHMMIKRLTNANNTRFLVTADHGFIYKRDKLDESDKISGFDKESAFVGRRYIVSAQKVSSEGVCSMTLGDVMRSDDERTISLPLGTDVFKVAGGGQNFVHGGSSLQEVIVPVLDVKTNKGYTQTQAVKISLISLVSKITNLNTNLEFIQTEAVSDVNKETNYKIYFISDDNEKISNENIYVADKKDIDASKRVFRLRFTFKNKKYDKSNKYYLVAYDEKNDLEVIRHEIQMDLAFADDFGFNL